MHLKEISDHSIDLDRLSGGWVLDVGARGFEFTRELARLGNKVLAVDPSINVCDPKIENVIFECAALDIVDGSVEFCDCYHDGAASHLVFDRPMDSGAASYRVKCYTIKSLMKKYNIERFDAIKLDCEGSEYAILSNLVDPPADQISVEFHDFCYQIDSKERHKKVLNCLIKWYDIVQDEVSVRYGHSYPTHWDSLFVLRKQ